MLPWSIDEIYREDLHAKAPLNPIYHNLQSLAVPDHKPWVVQLICHLFEVQIRVLKGKSRKIRNKSCRKRKYIQHMQFKII